MKKELRMTEKDDLPKLMSKTLESWSESMAKLFYSEDYCKKFLDVFKDLPPSPPPKPNEWDDDTPFEECNWFVHYCDEYEESVCGFKTKKKALLYMKHIKWDRGNVCLIKGKVVK